MTRAKPATDAGRSGQPWSVYAALTVVVLAIGVAVTLGVIKKNNPVVDTGPLPVSTVGQPGADSAACKSLMPHLPSELAGSPRRTIEGGGDGVAAWGDPAVILRCGMETPAELTCSSELTEINSVKWLQLPDDGLDATTYIAADRTVRIAVTVPTGTGTAAMGDLSSIVGTTLAARQPCRNGLLLPTDVE
ncbi:DUF3515 domain-containing protein [Nakamurella panacisegetis]|uniref:DUF3515 domain-containing protein n=1 Tax=Nakamurella panacisegetis TaxID=1090615 RepID=UPI0012FDA9A7|nr:DUF3515 domain-containing protein [Nakamurella panacisegetis]